MVASARDLQDQSGVPRSGTNNHFSNSTSLDVLKDQTMRGDDQNLKVRKPYTITKQRERWTEEEHKKFVEALKLYGRAWRRIEEHVGTKTAVQIRSHAQKFFSKVVRESNSGDECSIKPIEIPPPRPKRKPMHPYPRKLASPIKSRTLAAENLASSLSASSNLSILEQENRSPTSVLSVVGSDSCGTPDSKTSSRTSSPVSSVTDVTPHVGVLSELTCSSSDENKPALNQANASSNIDEEEEAAVKLQLFPEGGGVMVEGSADSSSALCLKLFGKTVLVTDCHRPSSPPPGACKTQSLDTSRALPVQTMPLNLVPSTFSQGNSGSSWGGYSCDAPSSLYCVSLQNESPSSMESGLTPALPWWTICEGTTASRAPVYGPVPIKACPLSDKEQARDRDAQKEGSSTCTIIDLVSLKGDEDEKSDIKPQSFRVSLLKERKGITSLSSRSFKTAFNAINCNKGFMPYKRCLSERDRQSSTLTSEERSEQVIRLCL